MKRPTAEELRQQRRERLVAALARRGLELRNDYRNMCEGYISRGQGDVDNIVDVIDEVGGVGGRLGGCGGWLGAVCV